MWLYSHKNRALSHFLPVAVQISWLVFCALLPINQHLSQPHFDHYILCSCVGTYNLFYILYLSPISLLLSYYIQWYPHILPLRPSPFHYLLYVRLYILLHLVLYNILYRLLFRPTISCPPLYLVPFIFLPLYLGFHGYAHTPPLSPSLYCIPTARAYCTAPARAYEIASLTAFLGRW